MTGIARHVKDTELKKVLKETDGLGTEATRAGIIELLFRRQFLQRRGKTIQTTETGRQLVSVLPDFCSQPDMTALWESQLNNISEGKGNYQGFMAPLTQQLEDLMMAARAAQLPAMKNSTPERKTSRRRGAKNPTQRRTKRTQK
jgi:DNA topoisomerase-3